MNYLSITQKIPLAMRVTLILLCLIAFQLQAEDVYSQKTKISLDMKNASVEKVLQTIEEESDYFFLYNNKLVNVDRKVSVRVKNAAISDILDKLFASQYVEYQVEGNQIILSPKEVHRVIVAYNELQQQQKTMTGKITDSNGEPIIGANIIEVGTTNGTVTDIDGNFSLQVKDDAILHISYIGYLEQDINTAGKTSVNVVLQEDTKTLEELVVIGYGSVRKSDLTGSISTVKTDAIKDEPIQRMEQILQGRVSGVSVTNTSGAPDGSIHIRVRGANSINGGNEPLYVVDGIASTDLFNSLDVNDIQSIEVLKDASSTAIYGSRGANGVVLVT
ncbi:MAG TPA: TonB-dependent receptor plug domain-containing protein, partial [Dysgonamonadaceae bacterium]|nr:TonB-dependent receptor plug domain-containing protein [Dysgonamonadaceae bacterium]